MQLVDLSVELKQNCFPLTMTLGAQADILSCLCQVNEECPILADYTEPPEMVNRALYSCLDHDIQDHFSRVHEAYRLVALGTVLDCKELTTTQQEARRGLPQAPCPCRLNVWGTSSTDGDGQLSANAVQFSEAVVRNGHCIRPPMPLVKNNSVLTRKTS